MIYKLTDQEYNFLKPLEDAMIISKVNFKAVETQITNFVIQTILPKTGLKRAPGTALPIEVRLKDKVVEFGIAKPDNRIIVPSGIRTNGEIIKKGK